MARNDLTLAAARYLFENMFKGHRYGITHLVASVILNSTIAAIIQVDNQWALVCFRTDERAPQDPNPRVTRWIDVIGSENTTLDSFVHSQMVSHRRGAASQTASWWVRVIERFGLDTKEACDDAWVAALAEAERAA